MGSGGVYFAKQTDRYVRLDRSYYTTGWIKIKIREDNTMSSVPHHVR